MKFSTLLFFLPALALAAVNEPCYAPNGAHGVCLKTSTCKSGGGTSIAGLCPGTASNVQCCTKPKCGTGGKGNCRWKSDCVGTSVSNQCPGPSQMKCCMSNARGWGGYAKKPKFPAVGACKATSVNGAKKISAKFPERIREIGCKRACSGSSDHCNGMAVDLMIADGGGWATLSGKEIAEWVMRNRSTLRLKYVIWGQKIWVPGRDGVKNWEKWRTMENRGDLTANHWDHVHVSFK